MLAPTKQRFSVEEYYLMAGSGVLKSDARVELLDGEIIDISPKGRFHGGVGTYLAEVFAVASRGRWRTRMQNPVRLNEHSEPQPDLVLARPASGFYRNCHPQPADVFLPVEISDTSLTIHRQDKLPAHGRGGIAEVWIDNLADLTVEVYREPHFIGYGSETIMRAGDQARLEAFPNVAADVADLTKP